MFIRILLGQDKFTSIQTKTNKTMQVLFSDYFLVITGVPSPNEMLLYINIYIYIYIHVYTFFCYHIPYWLLPVPLLHPDLAGLLLLCDFERYFLNNLMCSSLIKVAVVKSDTRRPLRFKSM